jgi:S1-C subfamily serine protease
LYNEQLQEMIEEIENEMAIAVDINEELNGVIEEQEAQIFILNEMDDVEEELIEFADGRRAPARDVDRVENIVQIRNVARQVQKSVVVVWDCYKVSEKMSHITFEDGTSVFCPGGYGTGYFITSNGCILTNAHVAPGQGRYTQDGTTRDRVIVVQFSDDSVERANVEKVLPDNRYSTKDDMALLKINSRGHTPIKFATSHPKQGDQVVSVGHPGDLGNWVKTAGEYFTRLSNGDYVLRIPLSTGASGSPIVNMDNELIGMLKAGSTRPLDPLGPEDNNIISMHNFGLEHFTRIAIYIDSVFEIKSFLSGTSCMP